MSARRVDLGCSASSVRCRGRTRPRSAPSPASAAPSPITQRKGPSLRMVAMESCDVPGLLSGATGAAGAAIAISRISSEGSSWYFRQGDAFLFRATARDLFGRGESFAMANGFSEASYRYGRVGLPGLAWIFAAGRPSLVSWPLIAISIAALAAIPGIAALLLMRYGFSPTGGAVVLIVPGLLAAFEYVFADPLMIALILLALVLDASQERRPALIALAAAILVKEIAAVALVAWLWRAW